MTYKMARRIAIAAVGATLLLLGVVMIVTPGPALVVIPIGLAVLSIEFAWARLWLRRVRKSISDQVASSRATRADTHRDRVSR
ncbi:MAG: PGPGW domain-containing protein [Woeseiaceae bacterium]